ncbi:Serine carboxypeptidase-like 49 [Bienertia sinuspersici]
MICRMFYFFFESRNSKEDPVVIWLTGGPGCSSELALFYENGPFKIANNLSLVWNEHGWDQAANLIFVDQPIGTGFSYSSDKRDIRHDERGVSNDLYDFLQAFFIEHPNFAKNDFYITGESYAGHYIPAFAATVHNNNKAEKGIHINLKGFAIGNGLTDPAVQYKAYPDYALQMGLIKKSSYNVISKMVPLCEVAVKLCADNRPDLPSHLDPVKYLLPYLASCLLPMAVEGRQQVVAISDGTKGTTSCMVSFLLCNSIFTSIRVLTGDTNYYDIRKKCEGPLCYDFSSMEKFLNEESVRTSLGVGNIDFQSCSTAVYQALLVDWMRNLEVGIPDLLEDGIQLLVYAGEYDLICNWLGNSRWVHSMNWSGQKDFATSPDVPFEVDGSEAGILKSYGPLSFLKVHDAGHMVPMDQPKAALDMLRRWTQGSLLSSTSMPEKFVASQ